jgi:DNA-binding response OmpR family regulator
VDGASSSPRELVVEGEIDIRESQERGIQLQCGDFATDTSIVDVFIGYPRRKLEFTGSLEMLATVCGVGFAQGAR